MSNLSEDLKKAFLFGVGAIAKTNEKAKELVDELVSKGAITIEQGKTLNDELKHNIQEKILEKEKQIRRTILSKMVKCHMGEFCRMFEIL